MGMRNDCLKVVRIVACSLLVSAIAACAGHQGSASFLPSTANQHSPISKKVKTPSDTASVSANGKIVALISGGFTLLAARSCGYVHVYTSGAKISGPAPATGLYAQATG